MIPQRYFLFFIFTISLSAQKKIYAQHKHVTKQNAPAQKPLYIIRNVAEYERTIVGHKEKKMRAVSDFLPTAVLDIRYATTHNFTKQKLYPYAACYVREALVASLIKVQKTLAKQGLGLKFFDAYRPYSTTARMYKIYPNKVFLAPPWKGSRHNRACAVDITMVSLATKKEVPMPTEFDSFSKLAFPKAVISDEKKRANRELLIRVMEANGFKVSLSEWWHFDFQGWRNYELLDLSFDTLQEIARGE